MRAVSRLGARIVIAGTASGVGKTTVATGLMAALRRRGLAVGGAKVGPDFIDPGYHALATGRPGRNLDAWMCGPDSVVPLAGRAAEGADVLVIEGVLGLFDGAFEPPAASTADVARLLGAPVVLVVDAAAVGASAAATVHGFAGFDRTLRLAGVVLNRVGSDSHEQVLRTALAPLDVPVLGALRRDPAFVWRDRHLGLVPVVEAPESVSDALGRLAAAVERYCDVDGLLAVARTAPAMAAAPPPAALPSAAGGVRLAVAGGRAFSFTYEDNLEALRQAGAELVPFDPTTDPTLPAGVSGLVAGGGFPEVYAEALAANLPLLDDVAGAIAGGMATWAECGGLLWLSGRLDGHRLAGVVPATATMGDRPTLGYRRGVFHCDTPLGPAGTAFRGHEFHYSSVDPPGGALRWQGRSGPGTGGFATSTLLASYVHLHLGATPALAEHFVAIAAGAGWR